MKEDLRKPEVIRRIAELYSAGNTPTGIAKILKKEFKIVADSQTIKKVYGSFAAKRGEMIEAEESMRNIVKDDVLNIKEQLMEVNEKCKEILEDALDPDEKLKAIDRIHTQIMIQAKLLESLKKTQPTKINIIHITTKVLNIIKEWEKQGIIEIKSPIKLEKLKKIYKEGDKEKEDKEEEIIEVDEE